MVARTTSETESLDEWQARLPLQWIATPVTVIAGRARLRVRISSGSVGARYAGVFDDSKLVGMLNTWAPEGPLPYRNIGRTIVEPAYQGHRITRQIIEWWVTSRDECLASDENQTHDGAKVWESMIMREPRLRFFLWHPDGTEIDLGVEAGRIVPDPWADPHTRLLARPR